MSVVLSKHLPLLASAPDGIQKLRELILELAVRGKLVPQDAEDEPASELLKRIAVERARLESEGICRKAKPPLPVEEGEQPFSIPTSWVWGRVATLGYTQTGTTPSKLQGHFFGTDYPFIKPGDISVGGIDYDNEGLSVEGASASGRLAPPQSILMVCIGTIGKCGVIDRTCAFNQQINSVSPLECTSPFAFIALRSPYFQAEACGRSSSTTIAILNKGNWETIPVPLPPLVEQHRIVAKVDELMALCDRLEAEQADSASSHALLVETLLSTLTQSTDAADLAANWQRLAEHFDTLFNTEASIDALKQAVLQLALMGKLVPQNPKDEPAGELLKRIAQERGQREKEGLCKKAKPVLPVSNDEPPFSIPENWLWSRLASLVSALGDGLHGTPNYTAGTPYFFVNGNNLINGEIAIKPETKTVSEAEFLKHRKPLSTSTVLVSINGSLGRVAFYAGEQVILGKSACFFNLLPPLDKRYIRLILESPYFVTYAFKSATGTTIKNLGLKAMNDLPVPLPPLVEQHRIVAKVDELMALCDRLKADLATAGQQQARLADTLIESAREAA